MESYFTSSIECILVFECEKQILNLHNKQIITIQEQQQQHLPNKLKTRDLCKIFRYDFLKEFH